MRALVRNDQEQLARQLDEKLAEKYIYRLSAAASMSSLSSSPVSYLPVNFHKVNKITSLSKNYVAHSITVVCVID